MKRCMISFDWAMKRLLRNKANFEVLEGFLSELLRRRIIIYHLGELVEADGKEIIIVELKFDSIAAYYHRMLFEAPLHPSPIGREFSPFGGSKRDFYSINLDEWKYYHKNNRIEDHFTSQGLDKAKEILLFDNLTPEEQKAYLRDIDAKLLNDSAITFENIQKKNNYLS